jgi:hypothetical protein
MAWWWFEVSRNISRNFNIVNKLNWHKSGDELIICCVDGYIYTYCTMLRLLDLVWSPLVQCFATEDAGQIVNYFITIPNTRN